MIRFTYSLYWDMIWYLRNKKNSQFLKDIKVVVYSFKISNIKYVFKFIRHKNIVYPNNITVYLLTSGTTGAYTHPDKIFICPVEIEKYGGLYRVLSHELAHLKLGETNEKLNHREKEKQVHNLESEILKEIN